MAPSKKLRMIAGILIGSLLLLSFLYLVLDQEKTSLTGGVRSHLEGDFVELPLGVVHYELGGPQDAPLIVLIHGFSVPSYIWDPTFEALVDSGYQVLRYDLYGRGTSDRPKVEYTRDLYVDQLQQLLTALNTENPIHIIGLSYGGPIAAAYAHQFPQGVLSITLVDPQISPASTQDIFPLNLPLVGEYLMGVMLVPFVLPQSQSKDFYHPENYPGWETRYRIQMAYRGFKRAILSSIRHTVDNDPLTDYQAIGELPFPVLLIWGKEDRTIPFSDIVRIQTAIPQLEFHAIEAAGHLPHYEQPQAVNPILVAFLNRVTPIP